MTTTQRVEAPVTVDVENVGGIAETHVSLRPGVNVLTGRNATNRTSFLQAIKAAVGSDDVTLKGDADEGGVELSFGDETVFRTLRRSDGAVVTGGDPYLDDSTLADLFAFLLEDNEIRRAVARGGDLRELVMRPVDTEAIREEIERLETEKRRTDDRLEELDSVEDRLADLRARREELEAERERKREELAEKEAELDAADVDPEASREEKAEFEARMDDLKQARSRLEDVRFKLESNRESLASVREEHESVGSTLEDLDPVESGDAAELDERIEELREEKRRLDSQVNRLQNLVGLNQQLLDGEDELLAELHRDHGHDDGPVTDRLLSNGDGAVCWTCGSEVDHGQIETTIERLRDLSREKSAERRRLAEEIDDLTGERSAIRDRRQRREELDRRLDRLAEEIDEREARIERLRGEREELVEEIETLEGEVEALGTDDNGAVLDLHREANRLEFELDRLGDELESVSADIADAESELEARDDLEAEREELAERLADLRTRIDDIEREAIEQFNDRMADLLDLLEYENVERLWIERVERDVREGRRKVSRTEFELHVVRTTASGTAYEDTVDHLSESEREVTGLVFALAGYLVHDVHEVVPFVLLDSLEAIDAERIATLVEYFSDYAPYLVVALLPEDAAALDDAHNRVTDI